MGTWKGSKSDANAGKGKGWTSNNGFIWDFLARCCVIIRNTRLEKEVQIIHSGMTDGD